MDECLVAFIWVLKRRKKSLSMPSSSQAFVMPGLKDKRARDSLFGLANRGCYKLPAKHPHSQFGLKTSARTNGSSFGSMRFLYVSFSSYPDATHLLDYLNLLFRARHIPVMTDTCFSQPAQLFLLTFLSKYLHYSF